MKYALHVGLLVPINNTTQDDLRRELGRPALSSIQATARCAQWATAA
jgi:hypothetical protein